ncbi:uncharacterized protein LOC142225520 [Haematobia irritans]|uniref:uncharacterized protein LOC142225520 n=1 Tax=Haematobia irritans TaxID=7368 RepID=UPI003F4F65B5
MENKRVKLTPEVKKQLCRAVEKHPIIWNKKEKGHSNRNAIKKEWEQVSNEVGISEQLCRNGWRSIVDSRRYQKRKSLKSGSGCNPPLDMSIEYLESSNEQWEFEDDVQFLEEVETMRFTDFSNVIENDYAFERPPSSGTSYSFRNSHISTPTLSNSVSSQKSDLEAELLQSVTKMANVAAKSHSKHSGFLGYLSSIMDDFDNNERDELQERVLEIAFEIRRRMK